MTTYDVAPILDRITYEPEGITLEPIPWPSGFKPEPQHTALTKDGALPAADVLAITWTAAEAQALADVLTPGVTSKQWVHYARNFSEYEPDLTSRSPAKEAKRLGEAYLTRIGGQTVCCFHSQLHPATDGPELPASKLAAQIATETGAKLVVTTGTAGGVGLQTVLGDVCVASEVRSDLTTRLKGHPWSSEVWPTTALTSQQKELLGPSVLPALFAANSGKLPSEYATRAPEVWYGHVTGTDFFAYGTVDDHFGLLAIDEATSVVEMDDFSIALGLSTLKTDTPSFMSVRNCSDPVMESADAQQAKLAESIYQRYGLITTWDSAICVWAIIAGLNPQ